MSDASFEFAENPSWEVPEQVFAEEDLTEFEEEDPEELVPDLSWNEQGEEPQEEPLEVQPPVPLSAPPHEQP
ncbi:hypothetical protein U9M48_004781 [Paspalum notatum var. saurae]|uniref:Uncharacterized protein n=1 Tax=Paspalum notatum var. saurae TaxID=547442 RepID=A0AAQ3PKH7_PASNO